MNRLLCALALAAALVATGCSSLAPRTSARLDEARASIAHLERDAEAALHAPAQVRAAQDALERAVAAADSLEDPALVDHLAYVAKQRAAIARATASRVAAEQHLHAASLRRTGGRAR